MMLKKTMELVTNVGKNIKISDHKCSYDFIIKKRYESINKNENIKWDEQYKNVKNAIENEKILLSLVEVVLENLI